MTPTRGRNRSFGASSTYEQRKRRRHLARFALFDSNLSAPTPSLQIISSPYHTLLTRDRNNNVADTSRRPYLIGAFIYWSTELEDCRLHIFESHRVKVRHTESESSILRRVANEYFEAATGKSTFVSSVYLVQRNVPMRYTSECLFELKRETFWQVQQQHQVNLNFQRKYITALTHEYDPNSGHSYNYRSTVCCNVALN